MARVLLAGLMVCLMTALVSTCFLNSCPYRRYGRNAQCSPCGTAQDGICVSEGQCCTSTSCFLSTECPRSAVCPRRFCKMLQASGFCLSSMLCCTNEFCQRNVQCL